jgi:hypothetical protein
MTRGAGWGSIPSEHLPGLIALIALTVAAGGGAVTIIVLARFGSASAIRLHQRSASYSFTAKTALAATAVGAVVHAAIVPTHWGHERTTAVLFILDTVAFAVALAWTLAQQRHWQLVSLAALTATSSAYMVYILRGQEAMDAVGALTTAIELAAALLIAKALLSTPAPPGNQDRWATLAAVAVATLALVVTDAGANTFPVAAHATAYGPVANTVDRSAPPHHATIANLTLPTASSPATRCGAVPVD